MRTGLCVKTDRGIDRQTAREYSCSSSCLPGMHFCYRIEMKRHVGKDKHESRPRRCSRS